MAKGTLLDGGSLRTTKKSTSASSSASGKAKSSLQSSASAKASTPAASSKKAAAAGGSNKKKSKKEEQDDDGIIHIDAAGNERGPLKVNDIRWNKWHRRVLDESLEGMELLHCEGQSKVETILKLFDLEADYGPAAGLTRMERWERASKWGLNPPQAVYDILMTIEGEKEPKYRESLYYGMV